MCVCVCRLCLCVWVSESDDKISLLHRLVRHIICVQLDWFKDNKQCYNVQRMKRHTANKEYCLIMLGLWESAKSFVITVTTFIRFDSFALSPALSRSLCLPLFLSVCLYIVHIWAFYYNFSPCFMFVAHNKTHYAI